MSKTNSKISSIIIKLIISAVVILVGVFLIITISNRQKEKAKTTSDGTITVVIEDLSGNKVSRDIEFTEDYSMMDILTMTYGYSIKTRNESQGIVLLAIADEVDGNKVALDTDFVTSYIAIYVDGKYAQKGIALLQPYDGMVLLLKETKI